MVPFWIPIIKRPQIFRVPKRDHNFDNHPIKGELGGEQGIQDCREGALQTVNYPPVAGFYASLGFELSGFRLWVHRV